ncbi:MAG TPA: DUF1846 family protein, partial [Spirochaetales bacterium]|nr:DUF1846 family protein [Spirochaetales bacterium]
DDEACREAAKQEVVRRYLRCASEYTTGMADRSSLEKADLLLKELGIGPEYRAVVPAARAAAAAAQAAGAAKGVDSVYCGAALQLPSGEIVTGKNSTLLHAATAAVINGAKRMAGVPDSIPLLSPLVIESIARLKREVLRGKSASLDVDEVLIALSIGATLTPMVQTCLDALRGLRGCQMHLSHVPTPGDEAGLRKLGVNLTSDPLFASKRLFVE